MSKIEQVERFSAKDAGDVTTTGSTVATSSRSSRPGRTSHGNVRRRGRNLFQARIYIGGRKCGAVHLGMYETETAAQQVVRKVLKVMTANGLTTAAADPLAVWKITQRLVNDGWDVGGQLAGLLPRWVCVDAKGDGYGVRVRGGKGCEIGGFKDIESAYVEACRVYREMRSKRKNWKRRLVQLSVIELIGDNDEKLMSGGDGEYKQTCCSVSNLTRQPARRRSSTNPAQLLFQFDEPIEVAEGVKSPDGTAASNFAFAGRSGVGREIAA